LQKPSQNSAKKIAMGIRAKAKEKGVRNYYRVHSADNKGQNDLKKKQNHASHKPNDIGAAQHV